MFAYICLLKFVIEYFSLDMIFSPTSITLLVLSLTLLIIVAFYVIPEKMDKYRKINAYKKWVFPNKEAALDFLIKNKPNLDISDENKLKLASLLFFSWKIEDDSNLGNVILKRGDEVKILNLKDKVP